MEEDADVHVVLALVDDEVATLIVGWEYDRQQLEFLGAPLSIAENLCEPL